VRGQDHQFEPVRNFVNAIFDRHAGHATLQFRLRGGSACGI